MLWSPETRFADSEVNLGVRVGPSTCGHSEPKEPNLQCPKDRSSWTYSSHVATSPACLLVRQLRVSNVETQRTRAARGNLASRNLSKFAYMAEINCQKVMAMANILLVTKDQETAMAFITRFILIGSGHNGSSVVSRIIPSIKKVLLLESVEETNLAKLMIPKPNVSMNASVSQLHWRGRRSQAWTPAIGQMPYWSG